MTKVCIHENAGVAKLDKDVAKTEMATEMIWF